MAGVRRARTLAHNRLFSREFRFALRAAFDVIVVSIRFHLEQFAAFYKY